MFGGSERRGWKLRDSYPWRDGAKIIEKYGRFRCRHVFEEDFQASADHTTRGFASKRKAGGIATAWLEEAASFALAATAGKIRVRHGWKSIRAVGDSWLEAWP
jgi:hypothetical protein